MTADEIAVGVLGARGKVGSEVCRAVDAAADLELVAEVDEGDDPQALVAAGAQVVVDFTHPDVVMDHLALCVEHGIHAVVGTTGFDEARLETLRGLLGDAPRSGVLIAPNFSIGAVLMMRFAAARRARTSSRSRSSSCTTPTRPTPPRAPHAAPPSSSRRPPRRRASAPAPDATTTALDGARGADVDGVPVHALRVRGLVAHQEVVLGGPGETLTIRHDSLDRSSFTPGVLAARPRDRRPPRPHRRARAPHRPGLTASYAPSYGAELQVAAVAQTWGRRVVDRARGARDMVSATASRSGRRTSREATACAHPWVSPPQSVLVVGTLGVQIAPARARRRAARPPPRPPRRPAPRRPRPSTARRAGARRPGRPPRRGPHDRRSSRSSSPSDTIIDADGTTHVRIDRTYRGLPVLGGDLVVHQAPDAHASRASPRR